MFVLREHDGFGPRVMLTQPYYVTRKTVNLRSERVVKVNVLDFVEDS